MVISAGYTLRGHWWARLRKPPITEERNAICCTCCHACTPKPRKHESRIQYRRCCYCRRAVAPEGHNGSVVHGARVVGGECMYIGQTPPHMFFSWRMQCTRIGGVCYPDFQHSIPQVPPYIRPAGHGGHGRGSRSTTAGTPVTSNPHPPPPVFGGRAWVPMAVEERRLETGLTHNSPLTPRVSCMLALRTSGRAGVGSGSQGVPGGRGPGGHGRACACAGWCQGARSCGMYVEGRGFVGTDASPLHAL